MNIIIPMAGNGSRFYNSEFKKPKPLIDINGRPMISLAIETLGIEGTYNFIVKNNEFLTETIQAIDMSCRTLNILTVEDTTEGAAVSALMFKNIVDHNDELIIANCDQIMNWDSLSMLDNLRKYDCGVVTIKSNDPKNSYVKLDGEILFREKEVISDNALVGIHYWKRSGYFFESANEMIKKNDRSSNGEFYIAPTYNYLKHLSIGIHEISEHEFKPVGTPDDLRKYLNDSR